MKVTHLILLIALTQLLQGCSLFLPPPASTPVITAQPLAAKPNLSAYYQWLKGLEAEQLASETALQQQRKSEQVPDADLFLLLLRSLPSSPIHNPYTAKAMLNQGDFNQYIYAHVSAADLAFVTMLRDQLNQQLLLLQANKQNVTQSQQEIAKLTLKLAMYQEANTSLTEKLEQLKAIEAQLNARDH
ncbi:hypothetical protein DXX93_02995 [Thalassotalea euphylliae]|uniref:Uncharacterized protein n=1 Tax=Thalassotalea euphylliae TaxID=1655234 RepID=A0A3E0TM67_9GAMM|nr:hypothetical protein [Thalassotalea euphylliae]REL25616.1 hypothetical protein DXX93_02995 [Thalassotalea euphylliae]